MANFGSLSQFYNSAEWKNCRQYIIAERTKYDGFVYDEWNNQPIVRAYDIVAHHKIPLTMQNVNDFSISLNPDNIMLVSQRSHNEIHARFGFMAERKVYYVYGAPCSGKTSFVNEIKGNSDLIVDVDNIWQCVTGGARYEKPDALKANVFGIRDLLFDQVRTRAGKWERAFVIEGGALKGERLRRIEFLNAEGVFVDTDKETCLKRLARDENRTEKQKDEWIKYINNWFDNYQA